MSPTEIKIILVSKNTSFVFACFWNDHHTCTCIMVPSLHFCHHTPIYAVCYCHHHSIATIPLCIIATTSLFPSYLYLHCYFHHHILVTNHLSMQHVYSLDHIIAIIPVSVLCYCHCIPLSRPLRYWYNTSIYPLCYCYHHIISIVSLCIVLFPP